MALPHDAWVSLTRPNGHVEPAFGVPSPESGLAATKNPPMGWFCLVELQSSHSLNGLFLTMGGLKDYQLSH